jgi:dihydrofolate reductase
MLIAIVAMTPDRVIGNNNTLPRQIPEDLKKFKELTTWHTVVMWRKTYESIPKTSRPLSSRHNIIITWQQNYNIDNNKKNTTMDTYNSIEEVLHYHKKNKEKNTFIIWWSEIYKIFLPYCNKIYATEIKEKHKGDCYFPEFKDKFTEETRERHAKFDFVVYNNNKQEETHVVVFDT